MASPKLRVIISALLLLVPAVLSIALDPTQLEQNGLPSPPNNFAAKSPVVDAPVYSDNRIVENSWTNSFKRALQGPTGQMVVHIAKEVIARQVGGSQVLSLNLTNLLILLFLKAIIFAAGLIGAGSWGQYARSLDNGENEKTTRSACCYECAFFSFAFTYRHSFGLPLPLSALSNHFRRSSTSPDAIIRVNCLYNIRQLLPVSISLVDDLITRQDTKEIIVHKLKEMLCNSNCQCLCHTRSRGR